MKKYAQFAVVGMSLVTTMLSANYPSSTTQPNTSVQNENPYNEEFRNEARENQWRNQDSRNQPFYEGKGSGQYQYQQPNRNVQPDNSRRSQYDIEQDRRDERGVIQNSPRDQRQDLSYSDVQNDLSYKIRHLIQSDSSLSTSARNVQVTEESGKVTLTGTVDNDSEKNRIESMVKKVDGVKSVSNKLTVSHSTK